MKLWRISQTVNDEYGSYNEAIVAAKTKDEATVMHPENGRDIRLQIKDMANGQMNLTMLAVTILAQPNRELKKL